MFRWIIESFSRRNRQVADNISFVLSIKFSEESYNRLMNLRGITAHENIKQLLQEALKVVETVHRQAHDFQRDVTCSVEGGKIAMYIDSPDGDGSEPVTAFPVDNIVVFLKKAA